MGNKIFNSFTSLFWGGVLLSTFLAIAGCGALDSIGSGTNGSNDGNDSKDKSEKKCEISKEGMSALSFQSNCSAKGINLSEISGTSNTVKTGARFRATGTYNIGPQSNDATLVLTMWGSSDNCSQQKIASGSGSFDIISEVTSVSGNTSQLQIQICVNGPCNILCDITLGSGGS